MEIKLNNYVNKKYFIKFCGKSDKVKIVSIPAQTLQLVQNNAVNLINF